MPSTNRKRVREVYFYKTESGEYKIDLVDGRNNLVKEPLYYPNRNDINNFIENLQADKNTKFEVSRLGMKIYNKKPAQRLLTQHSESVFDTYVKNLSDLKENSFYRYKVAKLLRSVSDILDGDAPAEVPMDEPCEVEPKTGVAPESPISSEVPFDIINKVQEALGTAIEPTDLTFWFQDQKFQLTKDGFEYDLPEPQVPKTSHNILGTLEYMSNLLGVNAERNTKIGENSFRYVDGGDVYKIQHIYTGDHNTLLP